MVTKGILMTGPILASVMMVVMANLIRAKSMSKPVEAKKLILPPLFMATGTSMFILPMFRPTQAELICAVAMGMLFSILLIKTSKFEVRDNRIYLQRSKLFLVVLFGLMVIRMVGKMVLPDVILIEPAQMSGIFFILALSMIFPWRIAMYVGFRRLEQQLHS
ncbi:membrane protein involved in cytochrome C biogenesis [Desulfitobacterium dichloroeliminans LMG P-21439]|uniref:Membrane protein involved in cytochrome C biogenesis n=1 Tax=Desulfitobacterium dichloroeliminans (strain LMG P-21439 / DCA1) TaxID=871963 RepID=L0F407_DESDL|nr:cytochrome c biogenesis protein CcdC [Desulfitobacterium dichloroeliminans]AGA67907.1 membrane protein involved in cytochrome C biogenesis [Desulfitobacterium dichloroeliminans LMG P-21439]